ncbi:MAG: OB-fold nucleic acid binding domain-containing protein, partial [Dehalococcoidia bacterium]
YTLGEADIVRKAMGKKVASIMQEERQRFVQGAVEQGYEQQMAEQVFELIEPFAGYAFNKAHSVSYALIAYWTAYFKANYQVEYLTALLNSHTGNMERVAVAIEECTRLKIKVLPPDVNRSESAFTIDADAEGNPAIRFGLGAIKHVGTGAVEGLVLSRKDHGAFQSLEEMCRNGDLQSMNRRTVESLIKVGALDAFGDRGALLAGADRVLNMAQQESRRRQSGQTTMFDLFGESVAAPLGPMELPVAEEVTSREKQLWEKELLGTNFFNNPLSAIAYDTNTRAVTSRGELEDLVGGKVSLVGQTSLVENRTRRDGRSFVTATLELLGGSIEIVAWPAVYDRDPGLWVEGALLWVTGKVHSREDQLSVHADKAGVYTIPSDVPALKDTQAGPESTPEPSTAYSVETAQEQEEPIPAAPPTSNGARHSPVTKESNHAADLEANGKASRRRGTVLISLKDTDNPEDDTYMLRLAIQLLLDFPGQDTVCLEILSNGNKVRLEMPHVTTEFCPELEERLADLIGPGQAWAE